MTNRPLSGHPFQNHIPQNEIIENALRKQVKLPPNDNLHRPAAAVQNWRLPPCRMDTAV